MTLAQQVDELACRAIQLEGLAGEMLATIKLNFERGYLIATNDEGKLNLQSIIASWEKQLAELLPDTPPPKPTPPKLETFRKWDHPKAGGIISGKDELP